MTLALSTFCGSSPVAAASTPGSATKGGAHPHTALRPSMEDMRQAARCCMDKCHVFDNLTDSRTASPPSAGLTFLEPCSMASTASLQETRSKLDGPCSRCQSCGHGTKRFMLQSHLPFCASYQSGKLSPTVWLACIRARELTDEQRGSIAAFLSVYKGQENGQAKIGLSHHPSIDRAYGLLLPFWKEVTPTHPLASSMCSAQKHARFRGFGCVQKS